MDDVVVLVRSLAGRSIAAVRLVASVIGVIVISAPLAGADTLSWDPIGAGGGTGTWNTSATDWDNGGTAVAWNNANNDTASFGGTAGTVTLGEAITAGGLTFTTTGYTVTASTLTLAGTPVITADTGIDVTVASILAGSDEITKVGAGTVTLSAANTHSGGMTVSAGRVVLGQDSSLGSGTVTLDGGAIERNAVVTVSNAIAVGSGGGTIVAAQPVVDYTTFSGQLTGSGALAIDGLANLSGTGGTYSGTITLADASTYLAFSSGTAIAATAAISSSNGGFIRLNGVTVEVAGITSNAQIFNFGVGTTGRLRVGSGTISGQIVDVQGELALEKVGAGTLTLTGNNTFTGTTTVAAGTLAIDGAPGWQVAGSRAGSAVVIQDGGRVDATQESHQFGWTSNMADITIESGGVLDTTGSDQFIGNLVLNGSGAIAGNAANYIAPRGNLTANPSGGNVASIGTRIFLASAADTPAGYNGGVHTFTIADDATVADDLTISTTIYGAGSMAKAGAGRLLLSGSNTYSGGTTINAGTLVAASDTALGTGNVTIASGATLRLAAGTTIANSLSLAGGTYGLESSEALGTVAGLIAGTSATPASLTPSVSWSPQVVGTTYSDVLGLTNTAGTVQILEIAYDPASLGGIAPADLFLGWDDNGAWVNAIDGNSGSAGGSALVDQTGSLASLGILPTADYLGSWGRNTANNTVWAVVDHNSDFAVIAVPEPGGLALAGLAVGLVSAAALRRRFA